MDTALATKRSRKVRRITQRHGLFMRRIILRRGVFG